MSFRDASVYGNIKRQGTSYHKSQDSSYTQLCVCVCVCV